MIIVIDDATSGKKAYKRLRTRPVDKPLLLYLCFEMAKRGDEHFLWALNKLGIIGKVLEKCCEDLAKTAREHGHCEFAVTIETSPREPFNDHAIEKLTVGNLLDAVRKERLLPNSELDSDGDLNSCSSGYKGDYDSEDVNEVETSVDGIINEVESVADAIDALDMDIDILTHAHENQPSQKASLSQLQGGTAPNFDEL